jgi:TetR/AcrR family transcriptional regulator
MDNRSAILAHALELFTDRGYEATGVQEIAERAGITKPTLYHYFGSKRGLLEALLEQNFSVLEQAVQEAAEYARDLPLTLEKVTRVFFEFAKARPTFYRLQLALWQAPRHDEAFLAVAPWNERLYQVIEQLFLQAAEQHGNMRGRQRAYATTFLGMVNTYASMALNGYTTLEDPLVHQAVHQFMHGIFS